MAGSVRGASVGEGRERPAVNEWKGDGVKSFYVSLKHRDGTTELQRITGNDAEMVRIEGEFVQLLDILQRIKGHIVF